MQLSGFNRRVSSQAERLFFAGEVVTHMCDNVQTCLLFEPTFLKNLSKKAATPCLDHGPYQFKQSGGDTGNYADCLLQKG
jgi:hypothetical protein